jgi:hypothetical protein
MKPRRTKAQFTDWVVCWVMDWMPVPLPLS